jgi:predicted nucleic acid-binding protein
MRSQGIKRAYLDTNVLIEYAWQRLSPGPSNGRMLIQNIMDLGMNGAFEIVISTFCIMELYEHFRDWFLLKKVIAKGFGYREFRRERKRYKLSMEEKRFLEGIVSNFKDNPNINFIKFKEIPKDFFLRVSILQENGIDTMDAFHILSAVDIEATHFVTKDGEIRSRFNTATKREIESPPIEMTSIRGFLKTLTEP